MRRTLLQGNVAAVTALVMGLLIVSGCEKLPDDNPKAVFIHEYINYAWGFQHNGYFVDTDGNILEFNLPEKWNRPDDLGYLSAAEMDENLQHAGKVLCNVNKHEVDRYSRMLRAAAKGRISKAVQMMYDAGTISTVAFLYEPENNRYRYIFIRQTGDYYQENESREARVIWKWMEKPCRGTIRTE